VKHQKPKVSVSPLKSNVAPKQSLIVQQDTLESEVPQTVELPDDFRIEWYKHYIELSHKAQEDFDKAIITLSGGGLGLSFAFLKDVLGGATPKELHYLLVSWGLWIVSLTSTLVSYTISSRAFEQAANQVEASKIPNSKTKPGGRLTDFVGFLNVLSFATFVYGVVLMAYFVFINMLR